MLTEVTLSFKCRTINVITYSNCSKVASQARKAGVVQWGQKSTWFMEGRTSSLAGIDGASVTCSGRTQSLAGGRAGVGCCIVPRASKDFHRMVVAPRFEATIKSS